MASSSSSTAQKTPTSKMTPTATASKMTTPTAAAAQATSPKIPSESAASSYTWSFSPAALTGSGVSTPTAHPSLVSTQSTVDAIPSGKSLAESIVALSLMGLASVLLAALENLLANVIVANLALLAGAFAYYWTQVHSYKLDPRCSIILDEANVLSITSNFDHEQLGFIQRFKPSKPSESTVALMKPKSLWDALFFDDRRYKIEEFYRTLYGNEYAVAQKREADDFEACRRRTSDASSVQKTQEMSDEQKSDR